MTDHTTSPAPAAVPEVPEMTEEHVAFMDYLSTGVKPEGMDFIGAVTLKMELGSLVRSIVEKRVKVVSVEDLERLRLRSEKATTNDQIIGALNDWYATSSRWLTTTPASVGKEKVE